jgi:phage-related protein
VSLTGDASSIISVIQEEASSLFGTTDTIRGNPRTVTVTATRIIVPGAVTTILPGTTATQSLPTRAPGLISEATSAVGEVVDAVTAVVGGVADIATDVVGGVVDAGTDLASGAIEAVTDLAGGVVDIASGVVGGVLDVVTDAVGIL